MDGFINLISGIIESNGIDKKYIFYKKSLELPGYFRPTKEWDLLVVKDNQLIIALEAKSQVGPSFGNNFNNRTEEAIGSAVDLWTAYRDGAFNKTIKPWLGYLFILEDCARSHPHRFFWHAQRSGHFPSRHPRRRLRGPCRPQPLFLGAKNPGHFQGSMTRE